MNSNQQGQGSDKSQSIGQGGSQGGQGQQSQSGGKGQQAGQGSQGAGQQSQSGGQGGQQGGQAAQRKDFDNLMSQSDQSLRDSTMQQGSDNSNRGSGGQTR